MAKKNISFVGWSWFMFNDLLLVLGITLKFHRGLAKRLRLKARKVWELILTFGKLTRDKVVEWAFWRSPSWIGLKLKWRRKIQGIYKTICKLPAVTCTCSEPLPQENHSIESVVISENQQENIISNKKSQNFSNPYLQQLWKYGVEDSLVNWMSQKFWKLWDKFYCFEKTLNFPMVTENSELKLNATKACGKNVFSGLDGLNDLYCLLSFCVIYFFWQTISIQPVIQMIVHTTSMERIHVRPLRHYKKRLTYYFSGSVTFI